MNNPDIKYYNNGQKWCEIYRNDDGFLHREDGPAVISWYENGQIEYEVYYINGQLHRDDGPARIKWNENGKKLIEEYWINDEKLDKIEIRKLKLRNLNLL